MTEKPAGSGGTMSLPQGDLGLLESDTAKRLPSTLGGVTG
jgi:hypothetical protein